MLYSDEFIESIIENPVEKIVQICKQPVEFLVMNHEANITKKNYDELIETYSLVQSIFEEKILDQVVSPLTFSGSIIPDCAQLFNYFSAILEAFISEEANLKVQSLTSKFKSKLGSGFAYEFTQGDIDRIQTLINELREKIKKSDFIASEHKSRLLKRLEHLQIEMHKKMSDLDKFWGLVGDAGVAIGKFGNDAKPFVDRIKEITDIIWRTQSKAEELPSSTQNPMLPNMTLQVME